MNRPSKSNGEYLATLEQFKYFGDISLLSNTNRNADVVAATDVTCYVLNKGNGFIVPHFVWVLLVDFSI